MQRITPWAQLANAVIIQAVKDYREVARNLKRTPKDRQLRKQLRELEMFFRSDWFKVLSVADGAAILEQLRKENRE